MHPFRIRNANDQSEPSPEDRSRVLVIGGAGFVGSALVPRLLERGHRVTLIDRLLYGAESLADFVGHADLEVVDADFADEIRLAPLLDRCGSVVHLAAIVGDPACDLDATRAIAVNVRATRALVRAARNHGVRRFLYASTCAVYGAGPGLVDERSPTRPSSLYARTKLLGERAVLSAGGNRLAPTVLRLASLYGLAGRKRFDLVVNYLVALGRAEGRLTVHGDGRQWRPFAHVEDGARAVVAILEAPEDGIAGEVFNVGFVDGNHTILEIAQRIAARIPGVRVALEPGRVDPPSYRVEFERLRERIGIVPDWNLDRGIDQVLRALESGEVHDFTETRHSNVRSLDRRGASRMVGSPPRAPSSPPFTPRGEVT